jgi:hypothetical protein
MKKNLLFAFLFAPVFAQAQPGEAQSLFTCESNSLDFHLEINTQNAADAYAWLSADGLRMYFTKELGGYQFFLATRNNPDGPFTSLNMIPLPTEVSNAFSCWLSEDELHLYLSDGSILYHLTRNTINDLFGNVTLVNLVGIGYDFISSPSFTPDGQEMYLFLETVIGYQIAIFQKAGSNIYSYYGAVPMPSGMLPNPGQLSKNGLRYYMSIEPQSTPSTPMLVAYSRESLSASFEPGNLIEIDAAQSLSQYKGQCTVSGDETCLVFTYSPENSWPSNDLYSIRCDGNFTSVANPEMERWSVYPNPAQDRVYITGPEDSELQVEITCLNGALQQTRMPLNGGATRELSLENLPSGMYFIKIYSKGNLSGTQKLAVQK